MACLETVLVKYFYLKNQFFYSIPCKYSIWFHFNPFCPVKPPCRPCPPQPSFMRFLSSLTLLIVLREMLFYCSFLLELFLILWGIGSGTLPVSMSTHWGFFPVFCPVPLPTTLELHVHTVLSNLEYFAVLPTRELKMPLIIVSPSLLSFAIQMQPNCRVSLTLLSGLSCQFDEFLPYMSLA